MYVSWFRCCARGKRASLYPPLSSPCTLAPQSSWSTLNYSHRSQLPDNMNVLYSSRYSSSGSNSRLNLIRTQKLNSGFSINVVCLTSKKQGGLPNADLACQHITMVFTETYSPMLLVSNSGRTSVPPKITALWQVQKVLQQCSESRTPWAPSGPTDEGKSARRWNKVGEGRMEASGT